MRNLYILALCTLLFATPASAASQGSFGGVGIDGVPRADGTIMVRQLVAGGPAHLAGIKVGDIITQIDGTPTAGNDFKFLVERRLRGRAGTPVLIVIHRPGNPKVLSYNLVRRQLSVGAKAKKETKKGE